MWALCEHLIAPSSCAHSDDGRGLEDNVIVKCFITYLKRKSAQVIFYSSLFIFKSDVDPEIWPDPLSCH